MVSSKSQRIMAESVSNSSTAQTLDAGLDLIRAAERGDHAKVDRLLRLVNQEASVSENAACIIRDVELRDQDKSIARRLLEFSTENEGFTPLHVAASAGRSNIVDKLVIAIHNSGLSEEEVTVLMNSKDCIGRTPLHHASWMQREGATTSLLRCTHVDVNAKDTDNFTPAHLVLLKCNGDVEALRPLLDHPDIKLDVQATQVTQFKSPKKFLIVNSKQLPDEDWRNVPDCTTPLQLIVPKGLEGKTVQELRVLDTVWYLENKSVKEKIVGEIEKQLTPIAIEKSKQQERLDMDTMTVMHLVAFLGLSDIMRILARAPKLLDINAQNSDEQTPLHLAALFGNLDIVKVLNDQPTLRADMEDYSGQTAAEIAFEVNQQKVKSILMQRQDMKEYETRQHAYRSKYVDGTNAILVGASVIASITFSGWLQPPLGYQQYYQYPRRGSPSDDFEQYAAITDTSVKVFWISNSLSFYFAIAAILAGAAAVVPRADSFLGTEVKRLEHAIYLASFAFSWAVVFVFVAFTAAGFASLPPILQYQMYMMCTMLVGLFVCCNIFNSARSLDESFFMTCSEYVNPSRYFSTSISELLFECSNSSNSARSSDRSFFMKCSEYVNPCRYFCTSISEPFTRCGSRSRYNSTRERIQRRKKRSR